MYAVSFMKPSHTALFETCSGKTETAVTDICAFAEVNATRTRMKEKMFFIKKTVNKHQIKGIVSTYVLNPL